MRLALAALAIGFGCLAGRSASAGETQCWLDRGVVVVPAALGDIAGDFILDLSAPKSQLHLTVAEAAGIEGTEDVATLRLAGESLERADFEVVSLNARSWGFPTNIAGVIGADALASFVVDLSLNPCRLAIWPSRAPPLVATRTLPISDLAGVPTIAATASDGHRALTGAFAIDTGSAGVRISDARAAYSRMPPFDAWAWRLDPPARLAAISLGDDLIQRPRASLEPGAPVGVLGGLGTDVWSRYRLRLDLRRQRLELAPAR